MTPVCVTTKGPTKSHKHTYSVPFNLRRGEGGSRWKSERGINKDTQH